MAVVPHLGAPTIKKSGLLTRPSLGRVQPSAEARLSGLPYTTTASMAFQAATPWRRRQVGGRRQAPSGARECSRRGVGRSTALVVAVRACGGQRPLINCGHELNRRRDENHKGAACKTYAPIMPNVALLTAIESGVVGLLILRPTPAARVTRPLFEEAR